MADQYQQYKRRHGGLLIQEGQQFTIVAAVYDTGVCPFADWLDASTARYNQGVQEVIDAPRDGLSEGLTKLAVYFRKFADHGKWNNTEQLNTLGDGFYEFKHVSSGIRVPFYYDEQNRRVIILTHGFVKKQQKEPYDGKPRAIEIRRLFEEWRRRSDGV